MKDKFAVVTGASYGLGLAVVQNLLDGGFKVIGISRTKPKINNSDFEWIKVDLTNEVDIISLSNKIKADNISLLVNNAGTAILENALGFSEDSFNKTFCLNFKAPIKVTSVLSNKLQNGLIINVSSPSDRFAEKLYGLYCASKTALNIYFDAIGLENPKIKIFNLLPSYINTPLQHKLNDDKDFSWDEAMRTEQVADCVLYMFNNQQKFVSGTRVIVISDKLKSDIEDPEKLWFYNVDTKEIKKLK